MDKKSIIGLILIFGIFVGYMFWVAPSKEEMAERQRVYDSMVLANVEAHAWKTASWPRKRASTAWPPPATPCCPA